MLVAAALTIAGTYSRADRVPKPDPKPNRRDFKHQVEALEEQWSKAQVAGDTAFMDRILADDYLGISMNGQILTKSQQIERTKDRDLALTSIKLDDIKVKLVGTSVAVVTSIAEVEGTNEGMPMNGTYRYTRVYQRLGPGSWRITNFEATRVPGPHDRNPGGPPPDHNHPPKP